MSQRVGDMCRIEQLTPEQLALIPRYRDKWRQIAHSTSRINLEQATQALQAAYDLLGKRSPKVRLLPSPNAALQRMDAAPDVGLSQALQTQVFSLDSAWISVRQSLSENVWAQLTQQLHDVLVREIWVEFLDKLSNQLFEQNILVQDFQAISEWLENRFCPELWIPQASLLDFCISELGCSHDAHRWQVYQSLVMNCGWFWLMRGKCVVCDRPIHLSFDDRHRFHAEGKPAMQFTDGYSLYAYQGVVLPDQYGKLHPHQWQPQWILQETNAELRRVLIQGIGYGRICQELEAAELDAWQEYTLLKINANADVEPIHLLKMVCPSTGFIHVTRVPPEMDSARTAIRWVNWDVDPEEFSVQT